MIEPDHPKLSVKRQCALVGISRSSHYYRERNGGEEADLEDMKLIVQVLEHRPFMGYRKVARQLQQQGLTLSRKRIRRLIVTARALVIGNRALQLGNLPRSFPFGRSVILVRLLRYGFVG